MIAALAAIVLLACWAGGATLYILFNDPALKYLVEKQVAITRAYETQAAQLHTEIDRLRSLKLIDQERVDRALADLVQRQNAIEHRQSTLISLETQRSKIGANAPEITGSIPEPAREEPAPRPADRPTPLSDTILLTPPSERWTQLQSRPLPPLGREIDAANALTATEVRIANLASGVRRIENEQSSRLNAIENFFDSRTRRIRKVLDELELHPHRAVRSAATAASGSVPSGGPFLPWGRRAEDPFMRQVERIRASASGLDALEREIAVIPVGRPTSGEADVTSAFGMRLDPFLRQPAMHTGMDFRSDAGDPVAVTAAGTVTQAERNGGYGLMVEVDHGNGFATRYAHLSAISVHAGASVAVGDVIGRVGSTGRSTGPHLHYEVRLGGEATDPQRFLRAGLRLIERE